MTSSSSDQENVEILSKQPIWVHYLLNNRIIVGCARGDKYTLFRPRELVPIPDPNRNGQVMMRFAMPSQPLALPHSEIFILQPTAIFASMVLDEANSSLLANYRSHLTKIITSVSPSLTGGIY